MCGGSDQDAKHPAVPKIFPPKKNPCVRKVRQARGPKRAVLYTFQRSTDLVASQPGRKEEQLCPI